MFRTKNVLLRAASVFVIWNAKRMSKSKKLSCMKLKVDFRFLPFETSTPFPVHLKIRKHHIYAEF